MFIRVYYVLYEYNGDFALIIVNNRRFFSLPFYHEDDGKVVFFFQSQSIGQLLVVANLEFYFLKYLIITIRIFKNVKKI